MSNINIQADEFKNSPERIVRDTSIAAYQSLEEGAQERNRDRIVRVINDREGATCDEIEALTGMKHQTASALIREMTKKGRLRDTGERRPTRSGCQATVWGVVQ